MNLINIKLQHWTWYIIYDSERLDFQHQEDQEVVQEDETKLSQVTLRSIREASQEQR